MLRHSPNNGCPMMLLLLLLMMMMMMMMMMMLSWNIRQVVTIGVTKLPCTLVGICNAKFDDDTF